MIVIEGNPIPNKRPRFTRFGKPYDLQARIKKLIRTQIREQFPNEPREEGIKVNFGFYMPIPKYLKRKVKSGDPHTKKPDIDNLIVLYMNCMSNIVFKDDALIFSGSFFKVYDERPRTEIELIWEDFKQAKGLAPGQHSR